MAIHIERRQFLSVLGGAATWPLAAHAQQPTLPVIGFLNSGSPQQHDRRVLAYLRGLRESGFEEGRNVTVEYHWAEGQYDRLTAMAANLIARQVAVIAAGGPPAARAAKAATATIPVVFTSGDEPVQTGLVSSLNRPGGNVTGVHLFLTGLSAKNLGFLHDLVPNATVIVAMLNLTSASGDTQAKNLQAAGRALGLQVEIVNASNEQQIEAAFAAMGQQRFGALIVGSDPYFFAQRKQIIPLAARHALPASYELRDYVADGGLMSYGVDIADGYRQAAVYAGRILKGERPGDLPVVQPTKFQFVINLKTAKALGLKISDNLLSVADEVIE